MRPCASCTSRGVLCVVSTLDDRCEQCMRNQRRCELAPPWDECERLVKQSEKLQTEALEAEAKAIRLRRQRRSVLKKLKEIDARERLNIEELEMDEAAAEAVAQATSSAGLFEPALSFTGFSQVSFGSFGRTSPVPTGSS
jgi:hypothetical protein